MSFASATTSRVRLARGLLSRERGAGGGADLRLGARWIHGAWGTDLRDFGCRSCSSGGDSHS
eukprot:8001618-Pyramimonas_sp.AAC.1